MTNDDDDEISVRVHSLADISSQLMDAFAASNGVRSAVVFVDRDIDAYELDEIVYDEKNECIRIKLGSPYIDIASPSMKKAIAEVNDG